VKSSRAVTAADVGSLVRIRPTGAFQHWMRGRLVSVNDRRQTCTVQVFTHRGTVDFPTHLVHIWKAKGLTQS
jgi:hypothetical protein